MIRYEKRYFDVSTNIKKLLLLTNLDNQDCIISIELICWGIIMLTLIVVVSDVYFLEKLVKKRLWDDMQFASSFTCYFSEELILE